METRSIPETPEELTPTWLTTTLRGAGVIDHATVTGVDRTVIGEERGFTGVVTHLQLHFNEPEPGVPASLVAKLPLARRTISSSYREALEADTEQARRYRERCAREVSFYRLVAPRVSLAPRAFAALADTDAGRVLLLLEDLSGGELGDALHGCTVERARLVVEVLAAFHAQWWEHPALAEQTWLPRWASDPVASAARYRSHVGPVLERFGDCLPAGVRDLAVRLQRSYDAMLATLNGPPATMIHADLHLDNVIFTPSNGIQPVHVLDWQGVARGAGAIDLSLFIVSSLEVDDRRAAERDLLARYHRTLTASGVRDYSRDQLLRDYRLALLWQLGGTIGWLARVDPATLAGRERQFVEAIFTKGQLFAALQDPEVAALIT
jgi:aminoglycoside/choline kinase family phosphotransferase